MKGIAPGRANIIGEHVDYNDGYILPFAIDRRTVVSVKKSKDLDFHIQSKGFGNADFSFDSILPEKNWADYVKGVISVLKTELSLPSDPLEFEIESTVPIGAGLSSSASIEVATVEALNGYHRLKLRADQIIQYAKMAENNFVGVQCGIMDPFASVMGKEGYAVFLDIVTGNYEYVPIELGDHTFLIVNSKVSHSLGSGEYNKRRRECEAALTLLNKKSYRQLSLEELYTNRYLMPPDIFDRALHVITETQRVLKCKDALQRNDLGSVGRYLYESHVSLRDQYQVSCEEIEFLIDHLMESPGVLGARIMGGGFGGSILLLVRKDTLEENVETVRADYLEKYSIELEGYPVMPAEGAKFVE